MLMEMIADSYLFIVFVWYCGAVFFQCLLVCAARVMGFVILPQSGGGRYLVTAI